MPVVFIPRETTPGETRVAATPTSVKSLTKKGFRVVVESQAGAGSFFSDQTYREAGAEISSDPRSAYWMSDVVLKINPPLYRKDAELDEASQLKQSAVLISFLWPEQDIVIVQRLATAQVTAFAMDQIPRISRAQVMDALTSQSNIAGYKAVLLAANTIPKMFPLMMTAAGTIKPAKVVILGAGVAGLQAAATAKRLGAVVEVSDIRPAVKEQVESLGAKFISLETSETMEDKGGYAREVSTDFLQRQQAVLRQALTQADVVITTALVPGKKAPMLIPEDSVRAMKTGSVIVDLAGAQGGNCALSKVDQVVQHQGVTILAPKNLVATQPIDASTVYANNVLAVIRHLYPKEQLLLDFTDPITQAAIVTHQGEIRHAGALQLLPPSQRKKQEPPSSDSKKSPNEKEAKKG